MHNYELKQTRRSLPRKFCVKKHMFLVFCTMMLLLVTACTGAVNPESEPLLQSQTYQSESPQIPEPIPSQSVEPPRITEQTPQPLSPPVEPMQIERTPLCVDKAAWLLTELDALLDADGGALWGVPLHGRFMIADAVTRVAVANRPDQYGNLEKQGDVYVGTLPMSTFIGSTAATVFDQQWGMVT